MVTVPVDVAPPSTDVGLSVTVEIPGDALIVSVAAADCPLARPLIDEVPWVRTTVVATWNVTEVAPDGTTTVAGTVALEPVADRVTVVPAAGAGPLSVTVAVEGLPPTTAFGFKVTEVTTGAVTVSVALTVVVPVPVFAEIEGVALLPTASDVIVNVPVVAPAGIVIDAGTVAAAVALELRSTVKPPVGAGPAMVTEPVEEVPPTTEVGLRVSAVTIGALTVKVPVFVEPAFVWPAAIVAVIAAAWFVETAVVVILKVAFVLPAVIVTEAGRVAAALPDVRFTTVPLPVAATAICTEPFTVVPP
jgi:hypothetical protein